MFARPLIALALVAASSFGACQSDEILKELQKTKEAACKCPDRACIEALRSSTAALERRLKTLSAKEQEAATRISLEIMACQNKL